MSDRNPTAVRTLLIVNLVLLSVTILVALTSRRQAVSSLPENVEEHLDMDVAYSRGSIALFVNDKVGKATGLKLFDTSQDLLFSTNETEAADQNGATRSALVSIGDDFEMKFMVGIDKQGTRVREIIATIGDAVYTDLNADGVYDVRHLRTPVGSDDSLSVTQVWFDEQWHSARREVGLNREVRSLEDGRRVKFDREEGNWLIQ
jgi:hypothetical protein